MLGFGLGDEVPPVGFIKVEVCPLCAPQFARSHEQKRGQAKGTLNNPTTAKAMQKDKAQ